MKPSIETILKYCENCKIERPHATQSLNKPQSFRGLKLGIRQKTLTCKRCGSAFKKEIDTDEVKRAYWNTVAYILSGDKND